MTQFWRVYQEFTVKKEIGVEHYNLFIEKNGSVKLKKLIKTFNKPENCPMIVLQYIKPLLGKRVILEASNYLGNFISTIFTCKRNSCTFRIHCGCLQNNKERCMDHQ